jgi:hypothetical protein
MDVTAEARGGDYHLAAFLNWRLDRGDHLKNFGLDFDSVINRLFKKQNILNKDSILTQSEGACEQFLHIDLLLPEHHDRSSGSVPVSANPDPSHRAHHDGQLVFLSGYPDPVSSSNLTSTHGINLEFWRRHLGALSIKSTSQFEDIKIPSAICDIFQLHIWTIGCRGSGARSDQANVKSLRKDSAILMESYWERLSTGSSFRTGDSIVRKYEVHDQEFFSIEQLLTISISTGHGSNTDEKNKGWFGESLG